MFGFVSCIPLPLYYAYHNTLHRMYAFSSFLCHSPATAISNGAGAGKNMCPKIKAINMRYAGLSAPQSQRATVEKCIINVVSFIKVPGTMPQRGYHSSQFLLLLCVCSLFVRCHKRPNNFFHDHDNIIYSCAYITICAYRSHSQPIYDLVAHMHGSSQAARITVSLFDGLSN